METDLKRTRLEGVMSLNYDACSIIAAETSQQAHAWMANKKDKSLRELYVLDEGNGENASRWQTKLLKTVESRGLNYTDDKVNLALAANTSNASDPKLLVYLRDDLALPIATFARRTGGNCSYVQLGQEMVNENFVVTPYDDRKDIVDSLRSLLRGEDTILNNVETLIESEIERNRSVIEAQLVPAFYRRTESLWQNSKKQVWPLWMLAEGGSYLETYQATPLPESKAILTDGREVDLLLAARQSKRSRSTELELLAVTRGNVALSLARFSQDTVIHPQTNEAYSPKEIERLRRLIIQPPRQEAVNLRQAEQTYSADKLVHAVHRAAKLRPKRSRESIGATRAMLELFDPGSAARISKHHFDENSYGAILRGHNSLENVWSIDRYHEKKNTKLLKHAGKLRDLAMARASYKEALKRIEGNTGRQALAALKADRYFRDFLGEYSATSEKLIQNLGTLAARGTLFAGRIAQVQINQDRGDILVFAEVNAQDSYGFKLRLEGRPAALDGFEASEIYPSLEISKTEKINLEPDEIEEILRLLSCLGSTALQPR